MTAPDPSTAPIPRAPETARELPPARAASGVAAALRDGAEVDAHPAAPLAPPGLAPRDVDEFGRTTTEQLADKDALLEEALRARAEAVEAAVRSGELAARVQARHDALAAAAREHLASLDALALAERAWFGAASRGPADDQTRAATDDVTAARARVDAAVRTLRALLEAAS